MRWEGHVARMGEVYTGFLVGRPEGKRERPVGRLRRIWEDNIEMDFQVVGCWGMDWLMWTGGGLLLMWY